MTCKILFRNQCDVRFFADINVLLGSKCKYEFCWQCLGPYVKKGVRRVIHRQECEYYDPAYVPDDLGLVYG
jgi:hypothetical protein